MKFTSTLVKRWAMTLKASGTITMRPMLLLIALVSFGLFIPGITSGQDIHYSHFHASPLQLNPAMTGMFDGNIRAIAIYKNQWNEATAKFHTYGVTVDGKIANIRENILGIGIKFNGDKGGDIKYSSTQIGLTLSSLIKLSRHSNNYLSLGFEGDMINSSVDASSIHAFDDESQSFSMLNSNKFKFDMGAGLAWYWEVKEGYAVYLNGAVFHINRPNVSLYNQGSTTERLYRRFAANIGSELKVNDKVSVLPSVTLQFQGPHSEFNTGSFVRFNVSKAHQKEQNFLYGGVWCRWAMAKAYKGGFDAMILSARLDVKNLYITFSYDLNLSKLRVASKGEGGPEVSLIYLIHLPQHKRQNKMMFCPRF